MDISQWAVQGKFEKDRQYILNLADKRDFLSEKLNYSFQSMQGFTKLAVVKKVPNIITGNIFKVCTLLMLQSEAHNYFSYFMLQWINRQNNFCK